jgi:general secretion pathway protein D
MTAQGFVPDPVQNPEDDDPTRQFFFQGGGGFRGGQMQTPLYGRGQTGSFVNLLQLRQNVGVIPDLGSNSLIITTTPDNMQALRDIIAQLDIVPRQVMIEVIIAEATLDATQKLGFQFDAQGVGKFLGTSINQSGSSNFPVGGGGTTSGNIATPLSPGAQFGVQAINGAFNALVQAIATDDRFNVLSTPKVFTSNNQQAEILVVTQVPYVTNQFTSQFGASNAFDFIPVGITLNVTPRITSDGLVTIDVVSTASDLLGFDIVASGTDASGRRVDTLAPRTTERTTDTSVSVRNGEIVALGGLMRDQSTKQVSKIPLLGDIPILGHLFRSTRTTKNKTELMIFMIPHVIEGDAQNRAVVGEQSKSIIQKFPDLKKQQPALDPSKDRPLHNSTPPQPNPGTRP